jgi:hypothetical protein
MVATLFIVGTLKIAVNAFASITDSLVDLKTLRGIKKQAKSSDLKVVDQTLVLTDAELEELGDNAVWMQGRLRAEVSRRYGGLKEQA